MNPLIDAPIKTLVVHQPWAWAIVSGHKRFENRSWTTRYRGPLAIVAGMSRKSLPIGTRYLAELGLHVPELLPFGAIVGTVNLVDVVPVADVAGQPHAFGPFCWVLENAGRLERPQPYRGALGLPAFDPANLRATA